jgi:hypothetical protein
LVLSIQSFKTFVDPTDELNIQEIAPMNSMGGLTRLDNLSH